MKLFLVIEQMEMNLFCLKINIYLLQF
uniref:Uncharacterized protein n=1 Tax=Arundo donax TaxID=35708 RepID=A0A0A9EKS0_ARUDO